MIKKPWRKLGEIVVTRGFITPDELEKVLTEQRQTKEFLGKMLVRKGFLKPSELLECLSEQFGLRIITLKGRHIDWRLVERFTPSLILEYKCLPLQEEEEHVVVAVTNPLDAWALTKVQEEARGKKVKRFLVSEEDMEEAIERYRRHQSERIKRLFEE